MKLKIQQTSKGIEISITKKGENLFDSMEKLILPIIKKYPLLDELSSFITMPTAICGNCGVEYLKVVRTDEDYICDCGNLLVKREMTN